MIILKFFKFFFAFLLILITFGCDRDSLVNTTNPEQNQLVSPDEQITKDTTDTTDKIKFKLKNDSEAFFLKYKEDGAKLEASDGKEIARFTFDEEKKIKIKNSADKVLGYIIYQKNVWKIENAERTKKLYVLRRQTDGNYKLESGSDEFIYRIKMRDYGFEVEKPNKQLLYKIKVQEGRVALKNTDDETVIYTKSNFIPIAVACFGFDVLNQEQKAALAYAVNLSGGQ
jgi:hypothetical protein